jgi:hypothetical protein
MPKLSRRLILAGAALGAGARFAPRARAAGWPSHRIRALTAGPKHHFFGYYGVSPWNLSGKVMVCLESDFHDRLPAAEEPARVGLVDPRRGGFRAISETRAWNLQQGALLHWSPLRPEREVVFNDRKDGEVRAAIMDVVTGEKRYLSRAISGVARRGRRALSLTYGRLTRLRRVVGYPGTVDPHPDDPAPERDGVFVLDLRTGESRLVVSIADVYRRLLKEHPHIEGRHMWFNHTCFNHAGTRFFFLARTWYEERKPDGTTGRSLDSAMFTANVDGSDLREVVPFGKRVSHFEWRNDREIMATYRFFPDRVNHVLFTDGKRDHRVIGDGQLIDDGHCSFAPGGRWLTTDRNHGDRVAKSLWLYDMRSGRALQLADMPMKEKKYLGGDTRCDLHPRWSRDGNAICFDALEPEGWTRQLHVAELDFRARA